MVRGSHSQSNKIKTFKLAKLNFAVPVMALAGLGVIGIAVINQDIDPSASASNASTLKSTLSYDDQYITISNSSVIDLGTTSITANSSYAYATDNVTVSTNVDTGYELYISSGSQDSAALTTPSSYTEIATTSGSGGDGGTPAALDRNTYGYAVPSSLINNTKFDSDYTSPTSSSVWAAVPVGSSDRIHSTNAANEAGDTVDVHYGANLTNALAPGEYTGKIIYSAVVTPSNAYEMSVSPASGKTGTILTIVSGPTTIATDALLDNSEVEIQFRQNGETKGVCATKSVDVTEGHLVSTCVVPEGIGGTNDVVVLIPRFGFKDLKPSAYTVPTMQAFTKTKCAALTTFDPTSAESMFNTTYYLTDARDGNPYYIRKLKDGNCWMVQNLRLTGNSLSAAGHPKTLSAADNDTDLASGSFTISDSAAWTDTSITGNHLVSAADAPIGSVSGPRADKKLAYALGVYYTWPTAVLNTGSVGDGVAQTNSICPKNWDLPASDGSSNATKNQFYGVYNKYSSNYSDFFTAYDYYYSQNHSDASYYFAYVWSTAGYVSNSTKASYSWGNTVYYNSYLKERFARVMSIGVDDVNISNGLYRQAGGSVRCVLAGS